MEERINEAIKAEEQEHKEDWATREIVRSLKAENDQHLNQLFRLTCLNRILERENQNLRTMLEQSIIAQHNQREAV